MGMNMQNMDTQDFLQGMWNMDLKELAMGMDWLGKYPLVFSLSSVVVLVMSLSMLDMACQDSFQGKLYVDLFLWEMVMGMDVQDMNRQQSWMVWMLWTAMEKEKNNVAAKVTVAASLKLKLKDRWGAMTSRWMTMSMSLMRPTSSCRGPA